MKDGCGFAYARLMGVASCLFVVRGSFQWTLFNRDHADCPLSGIKKRPLVGGFLYTSTIVISIGGTASVLYIEVVRW